MNFVNPNQTTLSIVNNGITYSAHYFKPATLITGVTDEAHGNWAVGTAYSVGTFVIVPELKKMYRCAVANTGVFPPSDTSKWSDYGSINSYRMFQADDGIGSKTTGTNAVIELDFSRSDTFGLVDCKFLSVLVELIDNDTLTTVYSHTYSGRDIGALDFGTYFYTDYTDLPSLIVNNLEWLPNSKLRLTFSGDVSIGSLVYGNEENVGFTLLGTALTIETNSKISTSAITGFRSVIRYGSVNILDAKIAFDATDFTVMAEKIAPIIDRNVLWIPTNLDKYASMITIGYIERMPIPVDNNTVIFSDIRIIGVN